MTGTTRVPDNPVSQKDRRADATAMPNFPEDPIKHLCILVVEDQMQIRGWIADMLRAMGVRDILLSSDGVEALQHVRDQGE
ncbi:MAG: hypothetical protein RLY86_3376, partial [Pseudomonadota bacterium]